MMAASATGSATPRNSPPGKNFAGTGGFGPWMVTTDELTDVSKQTLITRLNGVEVQKAPISDLVFDVPALIAYCSTFTELAPGDVIVTGTTGGVGAYRNPPLWMKGGDIVEIEISGIGVLSNPVKDEAPAKATRAA
ncbi:2-keto-4-pentenoate hydratase/2-oxohepta-3-ene-1,7-dioic acid hydratase in catechol pathway [Bradyrhizobium sp. F1.2.2]